MAGSSASHTGAERPAAVGLALHQLMLHFLEDAVLVEDGARRLQAVNQAFCELFRVPVAPEDLVGADCVAAAVAASALFHDPPGFLAEIERTLAAGVPVRGARLRLADGRTLERSYLPLVVGGATFGHLWHYRDVSASQRTIDELQRRSGVPSELFDRIPVMLLLVDARGRVQRVNEAVVTTLGWTAEQWTSGEVVSTCFRGELERASALRFLRSNMAIWRAFNLAGVDGEVHRTTWYGIALPDGGCIGIGRDLTEERRVAAELEAIVENLPDVVVVKSAKDLRVVRVNEAAERVLGRPREQMVGRSDREIFPEDQAEAFGACDRLALRGGAVLEIGEELLSTPHGLRRLHTRRVPLPGPDGEPVQLLSISRDVTRERELEQAVVSRRLFFETTPDLLCVLGSDGHVQEVNPAWGKFGLPEPVLLARPFLSFVHDEDRAATAVALGQLVRGDAGTVSFENRWRTGTGEHRWLSWHASVDREFDLVFAVARDVTEDRRRTEELARAREEAQAASRAKSQFLANMSHEIRTPMNGVLGMSDVMLHAATDPEQREQLETIRTAALGLREIIDDILDLSKIEAGRLQLEEVPFELAGAVRSVTALFEASARTKGITLSLRLDEPLPERVLGDPLRLKQVLSNLVGNAIKFTSQGGVTVRVASAESSLRFEVSDTGIGIDPSQLERVFLPFVQADGSTTRNFGGTGLGLAICRQIAQLMGGAIGVTSEPARGSTFWFTAPLAPAPSQPAPVVREPERSERRLRVLVAEDNLINQKVVRAMLTQLGHELVIVGNGKAAVDALASGSFDVVLMDCQMPVMDGYEATRTIRASGCRIPIVAMTAHSFGEDRDTCLALGMNEHLSKPVTRDALDAMLRSQVAPPRTPAGPRHASSGVDASVLDRLREQTFDGTTDLVPELIEAFLEEVPEGCGLVRSHLVERRADDLRREAHRLKSSTSNLGARRMTELCTEIERAAKEGEFDAAAPLVEDLQAELDHVRRDLEDHLDRRHTPEGLVAPEDRSQRC